MAQPHKGPRKLVGARFAHPVHARVEKLAAAAGMSVSQYVADVMALHVGLDHEVRELGVADTLFPQKFEEVPRARSA